jgi:hypothetical protein
VTTVVIRTTLRRAFSLQTHLPATAAEPAARGRYATADEELVQPAQRADGEAFEIVCDRRPTVVFSLAQAMARAA